MPIVLYNIFLCIQSIGSLYAYQMLVCGLYKPITFGIERTCYIVESPFYSLFLGLSFCVLVFKKPYVTL